MSFQKPVCNCPDASYRQGRNLFGKHPSDTFDQDWSAGFVGIRTVGYYCKHEMAVLRLRGEISQAFAGGKVPYRPRIEQFIVRN